MKRTLILTLVTVLAFGACKKGGDNTKSSDKTEISSSLERNLAVYRQAKKNGDYNTAIVALNYILQDDSSLKFQDTLARFYLLTERYESGIMMGDKILKSMPNHDTLRALVAEAKSIIGLLTEAKKDFTVLYDKSKKVEYLYQLATIDALTQNLDECERKANLIIENPESASKIIAVTTQNGGFQNVSLLAGGHYLKGMALMLKQKPDMSGAQKEFASALKYAPNYQAAQLQLNYARDQHQNRVQQQQREDARQKYLDRFGSGE